MQVVGGGVGAESRCPGGDVRQRTGGVSWGTFGMETRKGRNKREPSVTVSPIMVPFTCGQYACNDLLACVHARLQAAVGRRKRERGEVEFACEE